MDIEEIAKKYCMRELKPIAKKYGIPMRCAKKIDIIKAFPPEALAELEQTQEVSRSHK
jgi:2-hydroxychromene-2-carboxylate isomerase